MNKIQQKATIDHMHETHHIHEHWHDELKLHYKEKTTTNGWNWW